MRFNPCAPCCQPESCHTPHSTGIGNCCERLCFTLPAPICINGGQTSCVSAPVWGPTPPGYDSGSGICQYANGVIPQWVHTSGSGIPANTYCFAPGGSTSDGNYFYPVSVPSGGSLITGDCTNTSWGASYSPAQPSDYPCHENKFKPACLKILPDCSEQSATFPSFEPIVGNIFPLNRFSLQGAGTPDKSCTLSNDCGFYNYPWPQNLTLTLGTPYGCAPDSTCVYRQNGPSPFRVFGKDSGATIPLTYVCSSEFSVHNNGLYVGRIVSQETVKQLIVFHSGGQTYECVLTVCVGLDLVAVFDGRLSVFYTVPIGATYRVSGAKCFGCQYPGPEYCGQLIYSGCAYNEDNFIWNMDGDSTFGGAVGVGTIFCNPIHIICYTTGSLGSQLLGTITE